MYRINCVPACLHHFTSLRLMFACGALHTLPDCRVWAICSGIMHDNCASTFSNLHFPIIFLCFWNCVRLYNYGMMAFHFVCILSARFYEYSCPTADAGKVAIETLVILTDANVQYKSFSRQILCFAVAYARSEYRILQYFLHHIINVILVWRTCLNINWRLYVPTYTWRIKAISFSRLIGVDEERTYRVCLCAKYFV